MRVPDPLVKFDDFLIDQVVEPPVRWVQVHWGKSCFWLEKQAYVLAFACFIIWIILYIVDSGHSAWAGLGVPITVSQILSGIMMGFYGRLMFWQIDRREQKMREGWINEVRFTHVFQRLFALMATVAMPWFILSFVSIGLAEVFNILYFVFLVLALYLGACTPLPPHREKKAAPSFGMKTVPLAH